MATPYPFAFPTRFELPENAATSVLNAGLTERLVADQLGIVERTDVRAFLDPRQRTITAVIHRDGYRARYETGADDLVFFLVYVVPSFPA